mmetsp:Transcript_20653/g.49825  ORF Transcript_20653/g.49825 Transcript_20653/m.49825 type:complete len:473 (-) Transcript_20653:417-1835(-)
MSADALVVEVGHNGYGEPPDIRRPAQEFYMLPNQNPMAVDGNDDMVRPMGARPTLRPRETGWGGQKIEKMADRVAGVPITSKQLPLHVDSVAERKRRQYEACSRALNDGMGCSAVTWLRNREKSHPANHAPFRSAGANHPPQTAKGQVQNLIPGQTRPRSAFVRASALDQGLYSNRGTANKGFLVRDEARGTRDAAHQSILIETGQDAWAGTWPQLPSEQGGGGGGGAGQRGDVVRINGKAKPYDQPVVKRRYAPRRVDGKANLLCPDGLENIFAVQDRRGNREKARLRGEGGLFRGDDGAWLKRMWKINAWGQPGGFRGGMPRDKPSDRHWAVADGWAPPRQGNDGWGQKKWPVKGSHYVPMQDDQGAGKSNQSKLVSQFGVRPPKPGRPVELKPGCWRNPCQFPHGESRQDDQIHGLPYDGVSRTLTCGRILTKHGPAKRKGWAAERPRSAGPEFEASPWSGYGAHHCYF